MTLDEATSMVRQRLPALMGVKAGAQGYVYLWEETRHGIRVSEAGVTSGTSGACYMSSDPDAIAVCALIERLLIELTDFGDDEEITRLWDCLAFAINRS